jgi:hypothetical protein
MVEFSDGTTLECRGGYRVEKIGGAYYVLGDGMLLEVSDPDEGLRILEKVTDGTVYREFKSRVGCERCKRTARCQGHTLSSEHPLFDPDPVTHT